MYRYAVIANKALEEYLHQQGFIPVLTTPIPHTKDCWKYTYENSTELQLEIDRFYKDLKTKRSLRHQWNTGIGTETESTTFAKDSECLNF